MTSHVANIHEVKISTLKTTKCGKINKAQIPKQVSANAATKNTSTIQSCDHCHHINKEKKCVNFYSIKPSILFLYAKKLCVLNNLMLIRLKYKSFK